MGIVTASKPSGKSSEESCVDDHVADDRDLRIEASSGNVFADLGLPETEERLFKAELALQLRRLARESGLTQQQVAEKSGLPKSNISNIWNGRLRGYSVERLLMILNKLGYSVEVRITQPSAPQEARTSVLPI